MKLSGTSDSKEKKYPLASATMTTHGYAQSCALVPSTIDGTQERPTHASSYSSPYSVRTRSSISSPTPSSQNQPIWFDSYGKTFERSRNSVQARLSELPRRRREYSGLIIGIIQSIGPSSRRSGGVHRLTWIRLRRIV